MTTLATPTVHLNGTGKSDLIEGLIKARHALNEAMKALMDAAPNGRDYYVQTPSTFPLAQEQHAKRVHAIGAIYDELGEIAQAIDAQRR
jgi:2-phospho-L-lactate guanylyltransferase (CobY/MobA/RfbA family)